MSRSRRPRASHHARNCPTARPYAARVLALAIRPAKNSRNRAVALGPRVDDHLRQDKISPPPPVAIAGAAAARYQRFRHSVTTSPLPSTSALNRS